MLVRSFELIISITWLKSHLNSATSFRSILTMSFIRVLWTVQWYLTDGWSVRWTLTCKVERVVGYSDSGVILRCSIMSSRSKRIGVFGTQLRKAFLKSKITVVRTAFRSIVWTNLWINGKTDLIWFDIWKQADGEIVSSNLVRPWLSVRPYPFYQFLLKNLSWLRYWNGPYYVTYFMSKYRGDTLEPKPSLLA